MQRAPIQLKTRTRLMSHLSKIDMERDGGSRSPSAGGRESRGNRTTEGEGGETPVPNAGNEKPQTPLEGEQSRSPKPSNPSPPPASEDGSRPNTSTRSIQGSVPVRVSSSQGSRLQSPTGSSRVCSPIDRAQSATVRSITSPPRTPNSGWTGSRSHSAQPHSRGSSRSRGSNNPSRPESRMAESGTQSPLGPYPPSQASTGSHVLHTITAGSVPRRTGLESSAGFQERETA